jgi:hypothetical protein
MSERVNSLRSTQPIFKGSANSMPSVQIWMRRRIHGLYLGIGSIASHMQSAFLQSGAIRNAYISPSSVEIAEKDDHEPQLAPGRQGESPEQSHFFSHGQSEN